MAQQPKQHRKTPMASTTGVAAVQCGFGYVLIEQSPEYMEIARARIAYAEKDKAQR